MFTWMKNLFPLLRKKAYAETVGKDSLLVGDYLERQIADQNERAIKAKAEWETRNELEKKIDACYLGTRRQAFYGTYEEFKLQQMAAMMAALQGGQMASLKPSYSLMLQARQNNWGGMFK